METIESRWIIVCVCKVYLLLKHRKSCWNLPLVRRNPIWSCRLVDCRKCCAQNTFDRNSVPSNTNRWAEKRRQTSPWLHWSTVATFPLFVPFDWVHCLPSDKSPSWCAAACKRRFCNSPADRWALCFWGGLHWKNRIFGDLRTRRIDRLVPFDRVLGSARLRPSTSIPI